MTPAALLLVLGAAFAHAFWNLLAKRAGGGVQFVWLFCAVATVVYAPLAAIAAIRTGFRPGWPQAGVILGSVIAHLAYFLLLQRGYARGDLSLVYPLARGTGPLLSTVAAIAFLRERPGALAVAGALVVVAGIFAMAHGDIHGGGGAWAVKYGVLTGIVIAAYTLWDKQAVSVLGVPPLILDWFNNLGRALILLPAAWNRDALRRAWAMHRGPAIGVGLLSPLSYILVLTAMQFTEVSIIAPAREVSIVIAAALGLHVLGEGNARRRLIGACTIVLGVLLLTLG